MRRIMLVTQDRFLERKCALALADVAIFNSGTALGSDNLYDVCLWDVDTAGEPEDIDNVMTMSRDGDADILIPFTFETLLSIAEGEASTRVLECRGRTAYLRGEEIRLTELESALLLRLIEARGEFVSREELLCDVWGDGADIGIINVYIHYLREKLERGEKIIISSRKCGYKIDGRYIGCSE